MVFIKNFINKIKDKFKTEGSFREAITTWNVSNAYSNKNGKKFEKLLKKGKNHYNLIKFRENYGYSLLHQVISDRDREAIDLIISQEYAREIINDDSNELSVTPLHMASIIDDLETFSLLLDKGAKVDHVVKNQNLHLLHITAHHGSMKTLDHIYTNFFQNNIDILSSENWTPLHYSCFQNKMDITAYLIERNANLYLRNKQQMTPLDLAILQDNFDLFLALYEDHYDKSMLNNTESAKPVHIAACSKIGIRCLEYLLEDANNLNEICDSNIKGTPLHFACLNNNFNAVKLLCKKDAVINCMDYLGNTPLFYAVENDNADIINLLHEHGADGNLKNNEDLDAYSIAFYNEKKKARKYFLASIQYRTRNFQNNSL